MANAESEISILETSHSSIQLRIDAWSSGVGIVKFDIRLLIVGPIS